MAAPIRITREDLDASGLRRAALRASGIAPSRRMLALALTLEGTSRTEAAQAAGMDRQTLRDRVHRTNEEGLAKLTDRHGESGPKRLLSPEQEAEVAERVRRGPDLAGHGVVRWRRAEEWRQHTNEERPHSTGQLAPQGLCQPSWTSPKSRVAPGPESGARPRIMLAVDYPYLTMTGARRWLEALPVSEPERALIAHGNAEVLMWPG